MFTNTRVGAVAAATDGSHYQNHAELYTFDANGQHDRQVPNSSLKNNSARRTAAVVPYVSKPGNRSRAPPPKSSTESLGNRSCNSAKDSVLEDSSGGAPTDDELTTSRRNRALRAAKPISIACQGIDHAPATFSGTNIGDSTQPAHPGHSNQALPTVRNYPDNKSSISLRNRSVKPQLLLSLQEESPQENSIRPKTPLPRLTLPTHSKPLQHTTHLASKLSTLTEHKAHDGSETLRSCPADRTHGSARTNNNPYSMQKSSASGSSKRHQSTNGMPSDGGKDNSEVIVGLAMKSQDPHENGFTCWHAWANRPGLQTNSGCRTRYKHLSQLVRHSKFHKAFICVNCAVDLLSQQALDDHNFGPDGVKVCRKACRSRSCRRYFASSSQGTPRCPSRCALTTPCLETPLDQWWAIYAMLFPLIPTSDHVPRTTFDDTNPGRFAGSSTYQMVWPPIETTNTTAAPRPQDPRWANAIHADNMVQNDRDFLNHDNNALGVMTLPIDNNNSFPSSWENFQPAPTMPFHTNPSAFNMPHIMDSNLIPPTTGRLPAVHEERMYMPAESHDNFGSQQHTPHSTLDTLQSSTASADAGSLPSRTSASRSNSRAIAGIELGSNITTPDASFISQRPRRINRTRIDEHADQPSGERERALEDTTDTALQPHERRILATTLQSWTSQLAGFTQSATVVELGNHINLAYRRLDEEMKRKSTDSGYHTADNRLSTGTNS